jgi:hypothetical protein
LKPVLIIAIVGVIAFSTIAFILSVSNMDNSTRYSEPIVEQEKVIPANHELCSVFNSECDRYIGTNVKTPTTVKPVEISSVPRNVELCSVWLDDCDSNVAITQTPNKLQSKTDYSKFNDFGEPVDKKSWFGDNSAIYLEKWNSCTYALQSVSMFSLDAQERAGAKYIVCMDDAYSYGNTEQQNYWKEWKDTERFKYNLGEDWKADCKDRFIGQISEYNDCVEYGESISLFYN